MTTEDHVVPGEARLPFREETRTGAGRESPREGRI